MNRTDLTVLSLAGYANTARLLSAKLRRRYGWKGLCDSPLTGITRNPGTRLRPLGAGLGARRYRWPWARCLNIGTDGGGSVRIPAAFTGVFGFDLRPGAGFPASAMGALSHVGPLTRTLEDAAMMMNIMADSRDWSALPYDSLDYRTGLDLGMRNLSIALSLNLSYAKVAPEVASIVADAVGLGTGCRDRRGGSRLRRSQRNIQRALGFGCRAAGGKRAAGGRADLDPGLLRVAERGRKLTLAQR